SQIGHGAATDTPNGTCTGHIDIHVSGETSLVNGRSAWLIEHRSTNNTPTNADVTFFTGTLDDDAANIVPATSTLLNADFGTMMSANLAGGNVIIGSTNGDMLVNGAFNYNQPNTLTFLSTSNINFNASVQNSHATAGNINIVSGWDGTSGLTPIAPGSPFVAFAPTDFLAADVNDASMTLFGNNQGSVFIGDGTQTTGNTNVFGYDPAGQRTHRQSRHSVDDALGCH
ncbi:MAG TPA: hypothetical protein VNQ76_22550, partial [Planctomicrobium sp.]|nr:hypothetical protein [Planctomicrobium sp.]